MLFQHLPILSLARSYYSEGDQYKDVSTLHQLGAELLPQHLHVFSGKVSLLALEIINVPTPHHGAPFPTVFFTVFCYTFHMYLCCLLSAPPTRI